MRPGTSSGCSVTSSTCASSRGSSRRAGACSSLDDPSGAAERLREALELWRGPALADFAYESFAQSAIARLEELRLAAIELRVDADLALGRHNDLIGELESLVGEHPLRERVRGQLMLALYRAGRQAEALAVYQDARSVLVDQLGIEPSPALHAARERRSCGRIRRSSADAYGCRLLQERCSRRSDRSSS